MTDVHLEILRAAAKKRARQLDAHRAAPGESDAASFARRASLERVATRARRQLARAQRRRGPEAGEG